jgi:hypothetical protein
MKVWLTLLLAGMAGMASAQNSDTVSVIQPEALELPTRSMRGQKVGTTARGEWYRLSQDGMPCIVPPEQNQRMPNPGLKLLRRTGRWTAPVAESKEKLQ